MKGQKAAAGSIWGRGVGAGKTASSDIRVWPGSESEAWSQERPPTRGTIVGVPLGDFGGVQDRCSANWGGKSFKKEKGGKFENAPRLIPGTCEVSGLRC